MASTLDAHTIESKARELVDNRIASVRTLVTTRQALVDARAQVSAAEAADVKAYRAALTDGWTVDELQRLGLDEPEKKARVRRRATPRKARADKPTSTASEGASDAPESVVSP
mgnify:CR=1 FL=1